MTRRSFTIGVLTSVLFHKAALGQTAFNNSGIDYEALIQQAPLPYQQVPLFSDDAKRVLVFISFSCPFCFQYHQGLQLWGKVLPRGWSIEYVPVVVQGMDSYITSRMFWAVQSAAPSRLDTFMANAYEAVQRERMDLKNMASWERLLERSGVPLEKVGLAYIEQDKDQESLFDFVIKRQAYYKIMATPTVVVGGQYVATPDGTQGNEQMFLQLLTGLVSKAEGVL